MKKLTLGLLVIVVAFVGLSMHQDRASAASTPNLIGYFNGGRTSYAFGTAFNILSGGINPSDAGSMIGIMSNYLNFGSYQDQIGAAFIIDNMLGQGGWAGRGGAGAGVGFARANFGTWANVVNYYASSPNPGAYGVQWNVWRSGINPNSAYFSDIADDAFHPYIAGVDDGPTIRFYWPGGEFLIQRVCGNLEGSLNVPPVNSPPYGSLSVTCDAASGQQIAHINFGDPDGGTWGFVSTWGWNSGWYWTGAYDVAIPPPPTTSPYSPQPVALYVFDSGPAGTGAWYVVDLKNTQTPCLTLSCGSATVDPSLIDPFKQFSVTVTVNNNVNQTPPGATLTLNITPPPGGTYSYTGTLPDAGGGSVSRATFNNLGPTNRGGVYTITWSLNSAYGNKSCPSSGTQTFNAVFLPYLNVYGGDAMAGASPTFNGTASTCTAATTPNNNAGIYSWNNHTTDFSGAGAQYAVQALAQIEDFASAQNSSSSPPTDLSFANTVNVNTPIGLFGGAFGATTGDCDFTSDLKVAPAATDQTISMPAVPLGTRTVRYVKDADVYISGDIVYTNSGGSWAKASDIPYFELVVVGGDIYVDNNVHELDGLYVAEPDTARGGGRIIDCAYGIRNPVSLGTGTSYQDCNNQLVINGAFVAKQVQFLRTFGSLGQAAAPPLPRAGWTATASDQENAFYGAGNVLDGNATTMWHTIFTPAVTPMPHTLTIDMRAIQTVTGLTYLPRQDGSDHGNIGQFTISVSTNGVTWSAPVASGTWANDQTQKTVAFSAVAARYVRLTALSEAGGRQWASAAEIGLLGVPSPSLSHAGEVFNYTPELWLPRAGASGNAGFTSITGLPPVL